MNCNDARTPYLQPAQTYVYSMRLTDDPTTLERVAGLLRRRGHQVVSLSIGPSSEVGISQMSVEVRPRSGRREGIVADLAKLHAVLAIDAFPVSSER